MNTGLPQLRIPIENQNIINISKKIEIPNNKIPYIKGNYKNKIIETKQIKKNKNQLKNKEIKKTYPIIKLSNKKNIIQIKKNENEEILTYHSNMWGIKPSTCQDKIRKSLESKDILHLNISNMNVSTHSTGTIQSARLPVNPTTNKEIDYKNKINDIKLPYTSREYDKKFNDLNDKEIIIKESKVYTASEILQHSIHELIDFEKSEILNYKNIYYISTYHKKERKLVNTIIRNNGFDDDRGDYIIMLNDHLEYRYEIIQTIGRGSFGQVLKCFDHKLNKEIAIKIIRNKKKFNQQALIEIKLLQHIKNNDLNGYNNVIHIIDHFQFRNHLCITFQLLNINLYEYIKINNFNGLPLLFIKRIAYQLLRTLIFLKKQKIIHCDLKPENILLQYINKSIIKVIDFGSSCYYDSTIYTYIQSRFYRSPEVILGLPYSFPIDIWSFACILVELYTGYPLFPGENENEQLACIMEIIGLPPNDMINNSTRKNIFFEIDNNPRLFINSRGKKRYPNTKSLQHIISTKDIHFIDFLINCLQWDPNKRSTPEDAMKHIWLKDIITPPKIIINHSKSIISSKNNHIIKK